MNLNFTVIIQQDIHSVPQKTADSEDTPSMSMEFSDQTSASESSSSSGVTPLMEDVPTSSPTRHCR